MILSKGFCIEPSGDPQALRYQGPWRGGMDTERGPFSESDERPLEFFSTMAPGWTRGTRHPKKSGYVGTLERTSRWSP